MPLSHPVIEATAWLIALAWLLKVFAAARGLPTIRDLTRDEHNLNPTSEPRLTVIVPARNEAAHIAATLYSLLEQDYAKLRILAVDDRSDDATGEIIDELSNAHAGRLDSLHIETLPPNWLGKTHAMSLAADYAIAVQDADFLLFTDADVVYRSDALRRALAHAVATGADHLVVMPTMLIRRWDEALLLGFFQVLGLWGPRPWRVADPRAMRDAIGIGAFNMLRVSAYKALGGLEPQRMDILEDLTIGRRVKRAGLAQRMAFGRGLVSVHWAPGASGLIKVMTKNIFSLFRFHVSLLLLACVWMALFCLGPVVGVGFEATRLPALATTAAIVLAYRLYGRRSGIAVWNALFFPVGAVIFIYTLLRSAGVTLWRGGVVWRGTFYSLAELRRHAAPLR